MALTGPTDLRWSCSYLGGRGGGTAAWVPPNLQELVEGCVTGSYPLPLVHPTPRVRGASPSSSDWMCLYPLMPQPLNTPILRLLVGVLLDPPRFDISGGSPAIPPPILYPRFWGLITVEDGDSKGICGWEAWGRFWSRTRGMYEGGGDKVPQGEGGPTLSGG